MHTRRFVSFAAVALMAPLAAQEAAVRRGRVVDSAGAGVAATVHVRTVRECGLAVDDVAPLTAATDGTFELPVALGEHFAAFAVSGDAASALVEVPDRGAIELRLLPCKPVPLQVNGLGAWTDDGPLRAFVLLPCASAWRLPIVLDGRGAGSLPPLPLGDVEFELRGSHDDAVWRQRLWRGMPRIAIDVPPPVRATLRVVDAAGAPLAGAAVRHEQDTGDDTRAAPFPVAPEWSHRELGSTDAAGRLSVRLPRTGGAEGGPLSFAGALRVEHAAHASVRVVWRGDMLDGARAADGVLEITLPDPSPFDVTLRCGKVPFAHRRVLLFARVADFSHNGDSTFTYRSSDWHGEAETDGDGRATWPGFPPGAGELRLIPIANAGERLPACVAMHGLPGQEIDLLPVRTVVVRVRDAAGTARCSVPVVAMPSPPDLMVLDGYGCEPRTVTDRDGRAAFELPATRFWIVAADANGFGHAMVEAGDGDAAAPIEIAPAWHAWATWDVLVEHAGAPVPGASFALGGSEWIDGTPIPPAQDLLPLQWLGHLDWLLAQAGTADGNGRLRVRFAPTGVSATTGRVHAPGPRAQRSAEVKLLPDTLPPRIELK